MTPEEAEQIRAQARRSWLDKIRAEVALQQAQRKAELENKYAIKLADDEVDALSRADRGVENCKACIDYYCDRLRGKEMYWQPTIKIVAGKAIIGRERCPRWRFYLNDLCARAGIAKIYRGKTFADYQVTADNREVVQMAKWYVEKYPEYPEKSGLYFYGGTGTGKTLLASIITRELLSAGHKVIFGDVPSLLRKIKERFDVETRMNYDDNITAHMIQEKYQNCEVLVLDDIGAGYVTPWSVGILYEIINERYNANLRTIVTSNFDLETLEKVLKVKGEEWQVNRICSRLDEMCYDGYFGQKDRRRFRRYA